jgi:hypothetical protein
MPDDNVALAVEINIRRSEQLIGKHVEGNVHTDNLLVNSGVK